jgi:hypothetical protein
MRLCRKIDDGTRLVGGQQLTNKGAVANIALDKYMPRVALQRSQILQIARVAQDVQVNNRLILGSQPVQHKIGANESGSAGHKNSHVFVSSAMRP